MPDVDCARSIDHETEFPLGRFSLYSVVGNHIVVVGRRDCRVDNPSSHRESINIDVDVDVSIRPRASIMTRERSDDHRRRLNATRKITPALFSSTFSAHYTRVRVGQILLGRFILINTLNATLTLHIWPKTPR